MFHHGWPLSGDDWDAQMMFFLSKGYRVIAHDRRGHGRSTQTFDGNEMDTYAADVAALAAHLDLENAIHIGHSTGGGEVTRYVAMYGWRRPRREGGADQRGAAGHGEIRQESRWSAPARCFDGFRAALAGNRAQFYREFASGPFYGFNRPGAKVLQGVIDNWWRQAMMGGIKRALRLHQGVLGNRFHGGPEEDRRADVLDARGRRPDRADRRLRAAVDQAAEERDAEGLSRPAARHVHDACEHHQRGSAGVHTVLIHCAATVNGHLDRKSCSVPL